MPTSHSQRSQTPRFTLFACGVVAACMLLIILIPGCGGLGHGNPTPARVPSVRPGINEPFLNPDLDPDAWKQKFEVESREIFSERKRVVEALQLQAGMRVADIGAGTGLFVPLFAREIGASGKLYALDIAQPFIDSITAMAEALKLPQVEARACEANDIGLPANSINLAFVCDTYHHFEFPGSTLRSIWEALKPGGVLVVIDFERIPGTSRPWVLSHVRAGKRVTRLEIEAAGFQFEQEVKIEGFRENYYIRFVRP